MQTHFPPGELGAEPDGLGRDPASVQVAPADEDAALAVAGDPVDVEEAGEADGLVLEGDRPGDAVRIVGPLVVALLCGLVAVVADASAPEPRCLRLLHPSRELLAVLERRRAERDAADALGVGGALEPEPGVPDGRTADGDGPQHAHLVLRLFGPAFLPCGCRGRLVPAADGSRATDPHVGGPALVRVEVRLDRQA